MLRRAGAIAVAAALLLALAGCVVTPEPPAPTSRALTRPLVPPTHPHILLYCPPIDATHFDGDPEAYDTVYACTVKDIDPAPSNGLPRTQQQVDRIAPDAVAELLEAYAVADAAPSTGACPELAADPLVLWVRDGDDTFAIRAPVDECGIPTPEAAQAFTDAPRETILVAREAEIDG